MADVNRFDEFAGNVQRAMKPVSTPPAFRAHLRDGLMLAAQHQQTHRVLEDAEVRNDNPWLWLMLAAMVGALVGFAVMRLSARNARRFIETPPAI